MERYLVWEQTDTAGHALPPLEQLCLPAPAKFGNQTKFDLVWFSLGWYLQTPPLQCILLIQPCLQPPAPTASACPLQPFVRQLGSRVPPFDFAVRGVTSMSVRGRRRGGWGGIACVGVVGPSQVIGGAGVVFHHSQPKNRGHGDASQGVDGGRGLVRGTAAAGLIAEHSYSLSKMLKTNNALSSLW